MQHKSLSFILNPIFNWFNIQKSHIHGLGLFSRREIPQGAYLGIAMIKKSAASNYQEHLIEGYGASSEDEWLRVIGARFINHAVEGNIRLEYYGTQVVAYALRKISVGEEITANYVNIYREINLPIPDFCLQSA
ncbi:MAG: SET domain-containing protein [Neisseriales bacterium]|nr:MAG: SET domain-containing protein [Neisseriales bacterium]